MSKLFFHAAIALAGFASLSAADQTITALAVNSASPAGLQVTTAATDGVARTIARFGPLSGNSAYNDAEQRIVVYGSGDNTQARSALVLQQYSSPGIRDSYLASNGINTSKIPSVNGGLNNSLQLFSVGFQPLQLGANNTAAITVDTSANVMIGDYTAATGEKLRIGGSFRAGWGSSLIGGSTAVGAFNTPESLTLQNSTATAGNSTAISNRDSAGVPNVILGFNNVNHAGTGGTGTLAIGTRVAGSFDARLSINATGAVIVGGDPAGSELLKVGGAIAAGGYTRAGLTSACIVSQGLMGAGWNGMWQRYNSTTNQGEIQAESQGIAYRPLRLQPAGSVVIIGPTDPYPTSASLLRVAGGADVKGTMRAQEVVVTVTGWSDDVFSSDYRLPSLKEVERSILDDRHLPGIPDEVTLVRGGLPIGDMQRMQMAKIEELTLYAITADKRADAAAEKAIEVEKHGRDQTARIEFLEAENRALQARLEKIEALLGVAHP